MCDADRVRERGLPVADYFLWNDDFEYSTRLIRGGVGLYCPASVVVHKTRGLRLDRRRPGRAVLLRGPQQGVDVRAVARPEPAREGAVRRLDGAALGAHLRRVLGPAGAPRRALRRGLRAGLRRPRSNAEVLADARPPLAARGRPAAVHAAGEHLGPATTPSLPPRGRASPRRRPRPARRTRWCWSRTGPVPGRAGRARSRTSSRPLPMPVVHLELPDNLGLGPALDAGLAASSHEVVARMDADDVSVPERFERQVALIEAGADIVGSGLLEFGAVDPRRGRPAYAAHRSRRDPAGDPVPGPVQPPDRGLPAQRGPGRGRLRGPGAAGGLPAVHPDGRGPGRRRPTSPSRWSTTGWARAPTPGAAGRPCCAARCGCSAGSASSASPPAPSSCATSAVRGGYRLVPEGVRKVAYRRLLANRTGRAARLTRL